MWSTIIFGLSFNLTRMKNQQILPYVSWIVGGLIAAIGLLLIFPNPIGGIIWLIMAAIVIPPVSEKIPQLKPWFVKAGLLVVLFLIFGVTASQTLSEDPLIGTIEAKQGVRTEDEVRDFSYILAELLYLYRDAYLFEQETFNVKWGEMTQEEYQGMLELAEFNWEMVAYTAEYLGRFEEYAGDEIAFSTIPEGSWLMASAYAISPEQMTEEIAPVDIPGLDEIEIKNYEWVMKQKKSQEAIKEWKADQQKIWEKADLIKAAYPSKSWLAVVKETFGVDAGTAIERIRERQGNLQQSFKDEMAFYDSVDKAKLAASTGGKVVLYGVGAAAAVASGGGALAATSLFIGGIDVGLSVGETIDVIYNGADPSSWDNIKSKTAPLFMITNATSLLQNPKNWDHENILFLNDLALEGLNPDQPVIMNVDPKTKNVGIYQYDDIAKLLSTPGATSAEIKSGNEFLPPHLQGGFDNLPFESEQERKQRINAMMEYLQTPEIQQIITKRIEEKKAEDELHKQRQEDAKKIEAQKQAERDAAAKKKAQEEAQQKLYDLENPKPNYTPPDPYYTPPAEEDFIEPTPTPTPVPEPEPEPEEPKWPTAVSGQAVKACESCWQSGMDCVCGDTKCVCCAVNAVDCSPNN